MKGFDRKKNKNKNCRDLFFLFVALCYTGNESSDIEELKTIKLPEWAHRLRVGSGLMDSICIGFGSILVLEQTRQKVV